MVFLWVCRWFFFCRLSLTSGHSLASAKQGSIVVVFSLIGLGFPPLMVLSYCSPKGRLEHLSLFRNPGRMYTSVVNPYSMWTKTVGFKHKQQNTSMPRLFCGWFYFGRWDSSRCLVCFWFPFEATPKGVREDPQHSRLNMGLHLVPFKHMYIYNKNRFPFKTINIKHPKSGDTATYGPLLVVLVLHGRVSSNSGARKLG